VNENENAYELILFKSVAKNNRGQQFFRDLGTSF
jgi:hypothetical protein